MFIKTTRCGKNWPRTYTTYHQEISPPFRRSEAATVYRIGRLGIVIGRWDSAAADEHAAFSAALQARDIDPLDDAGRLQSNFRRKGSNL